MDLDEAQSRELRALLLTTPSLRAGSQDVVEAILAELADLDDDDPPPEWIPTAEWAGPLDVGEVRRRLRWTLAEISAADAS